MSNLIQGEAAMYHGVLFILPCQPTTNFPTTERDFSVQHTFNKSQVKSPAGALKLQTVLSSVGANPLFSVPSGLNQLVFQVSLRLVFIFTSGN